MPFTSATAAVPFQSGSAPAWYRFRHGSFECTVASDGPITLRPPTALVPSAPQAEVERLLSAAFLPTDSLTLDQNALVVNTGEKVVLFDTGFGVDRSITRDAGRLLGRLRASGIDPASVDIVAITHGHLDHAGGLVDERGRPNFPNARVAMGAADYDFWTDLSKTSNGGWVGGFVRGARRNFKPYRDRLIPLGDRTEIAPGVTAISTSGHTVGHHVFVVESEGRSLWVTGDLAHHHVLSLRRPEWVDAFDTDTAAGAAKRREVFGQLARERQTVLAYHFPFPGIGHVTAEGEGFGWNPARLTTVL